MTKKKEIEVLVHYPEDQAECERKIRKTIAEWYAETVKSKLEQSGLSKEEQLEAVNQLIVRLNQEENRINLLEKSEFALIEQ